ncbi:hypothetical protein KFK09_020599 [Dendrobium nobile]|uniref:Uncharacterized protein n=1 Tax=Dendrobium nobile TaxID=94219 RepID=A0A8T3ALE4_DENNO|nr:hypothetical protein KFK09_020599 [Dendrobium nobile]
MGGDRSRRRRIRGEVTRTASNRYEVTGFPFEFDLISTRFAAEFVDPSSISTPEGWPELFSSPERGGAGGRSGGKLGDRAGASSFAYRELGGLFRRGGMPCGLKGEKPTFKWMEDQAPSSSQLIEVNIDVASTVATVSGSKICGGAVCDFSDKVMCGCMKANSLAILTDAAHLLSDVAAFAISLFSLWASGWEATHANLMVFSELRFSELWFPFNLFGF